MERVTAEVLVDKSAFARMREPSVSAAIAPLIQAGLVATCGIVALEILFSTTSQREFQSVRRDMDVRLVSVATLQADFVRAMDVMEVLSAGGRHRAVRIPDLLIAATAERCGLTIVHYDADFDRIAEVTGQPTQWVVTRGSI